MIVLNLCAKVRNFYVSYKLFTFFFWYLRDLGVSLELKNKGNGKTMEDFVHLHVHTYYSILDGQSSIKKLVDKAIADGMKGMAITDHGDMFGIKEFHDICNGVNKARKKKD